MYLAEEVQNYVAEFGYELQCIDMACATLMQLFECYLRPLQMLLRLRVAK